MAMETQPVKTKQINHETGRTATDIKEGNKKDKKMAGHNALARRNRQKVAAIDQRTRPMGRLGSRRGLAKDLGQEERQLRSGDELCDVGLAVPKRASRCGADGRHSHCGGWQRRHRHGRDNDTMDVPFVRRRKRRCNGALLLPIGHQQRTTENRCRYADGNRRVVRDDAMCMRIHQRRRGGRRL